VDRNLTGKVVKTDSYSFVQSHHINWHNQWNAQNKTKDSIFLSVPHVKTQSTMLHCLLHFNPAVCS